jgi:hypothetical protein
MKISTIKKSDSKGINVCFEKRSRDFSITYSKLRDTKFHFHIYRNYPFGFVFKDFKICIWKVRIELDTLPF